MIGLTAVSNPICTENYLHCRKDLVAAYAIKHNRKFTISCKW